MIKILLTILTILTSQFSYASNESKQIKIDKLLKRYTENKVFSGVVLVSKNGSIIYNKASGFANQSWKINNTSETKFGIGSFSKTIVAVLVMQLVQEEKLKLSDSIVDFLPNYPTEKGKKITIHHLLSHRSGMPNYFAIPGWTSGEFNKSMSLKNFEQVLYNLPLSFPPGTSKMYSNSGYFLLGRIIENITEDSFANNIQDRIFTPAKMKNSGIHYSQAVIDKMATSYQFGQSGGFRETTINRDLFRAAGDLFSTSEDLFRFERAFDKNLLLTSESKKRLLQPSISYGWEQFNLSFGSKVKKVYAYSGQLLGYNSMLTRFPESKSAIILLGNIGTSASERRKITEEIVSILFDNSINSSVKTSPLRLSMRLHKALYENNFYDAIGQANTQLIHGDRDGLKSLAQQLTWSGKIQEAEAIVRLLEK